MSDLFSLMNQREQMQRCAERYKGHLDLYELYRSEERRLSRIISQKLQEHTKLIARDILRTKVKDEARENEVK